MYTWTSPKNCVLESNSIPVSAIELMADELIQKHQLLNENRGYYFHLNLEWIGSFLMSTGYTHIMNSKEYRKLFKRLQYRLEKMKGYKITNHDKNN